MDWATTAAIVAAAAALIGALVGAVTALVKLARWFLDREHDRAYTRFLEEEARETIEEKNREIARLEAELRHYREEASS